MVTLSQTLLRRNSHRKPPSTAGTVSSQFLNKLVILHDWWLIKADSDFNGKRLAIGGFTSREKLGKRCFLSAPIVERRDAATLKTADGITIMVHGHLSRHRTLDNGFSHKICDRFLFGFPYDWEEFSALSSFEKDKMASPEYDGSNILKNIFDGIMQQNDGSTVLCNETIKANVSALDDISSNHEIKTPKQKKGYDGCFDDDNRSRPLTRSRTRLLKK